MLNGHRLAVPAAYTVSHQQEVSYVAVASGSSAIVALETICGSPLKEHAGHFGPIPRRALARFGLEFDHVLSDETT